MLPCVLDRSTLGFFAGAPTSLTRGDRSGTMPPGFVRPAILDTDWRRVAILAERKVAIKKDGTPRKRVSLVQLGGRLHVAGGGAATGRRRLPALRVSQAGGRRLALRAVPRRVHTVAGKCRSASVKRLFHASFQPGSGRRRAGGKARRWSSAGARAAGPHPRRQARFPGDAGQRPALPVVPCDGAATTPTAPAVSAEVDWTVRQAPGKAGRRREVSGPRTSLAAN